MLGSYDMEWLLGVADANVELLDSFWVVYFGSVRLIIKKSCSMNAWMNECMNEWTNEWMNKWMNEQMNEWTNEQMNEWMNKWMKEWISELYIS